jgi:hypothetical protein
MAITRYLIQSHHLAAEAVALVLPLHQMALLVVQEAVAAVAKVNTQQEELGQLVKAFRVGTVVETQEAVAEEQAQLGQTLVDQME